MTIDGKPMHLQFGVYTFVYRHGVEVPVQAQENKWASPWTKNSFYIRMEGEPSLCWKLLMLDSVTAEGIMTDGCATAVEALRTLSRHHCARDLVEEFVCAKVLPLRANQAWFMVKDDERYQG